MMAPKKRMSPKQARALKVAKRPITAPKKRKTAAPKTDRRWLDHLLGVHVNLDGETLTVGLTVAPEVASLVLDVNGRGVWSGQP
jgi:hypothetical protein